MARRNFQQLFKSGIKPSEFLIVYYLIDMCNDWAFTTESAKTIAAFFEMDVSNIYARVAKLKKLEVIKEVEYNGRKGLMVNPLYCYGGNMRLRRFREKLWREEVIYDSSRHVKYFGPPVLPEAEFRNRAIIRDRHGDFAWAKKTNK